MENRKIITSFYVAAAGLVWLVSHRFIYYLYDQFYQIRRFAGIAVVREALPLILGAVIFVIVFKNSKVNLFMDEVITELKKVTWPTREDVARSTTVVFVCIVIASLVLFTFDVIWNRVFTYLLNA